MPNPGRVLCAISAPCVCEIGESNDKGTLLTEYNLTLPNPTYYLQPSVSVGVASPLHC